MSRHHKSVTNEVAHMILDTKNMSHAELMKTYNVEVWEDGQVYDLTLNHVYANVSEWANTTVDDGNEDDFDYDEFFDGDEMNATDWNR